LTNKNYIEEFNALAIELAIYTKVELLGYHTFLGLTRKEIDDLEIKYNCQLDDTIRAFYSQTNGLQLLWIFKNNPNFDSKKYPEFQKNTAPVAWDYAIENFEKEDGCLILLPLEDVLRKLVSPNIYQEDISFMGRTYSTIDFHSHLRPFDSFSYYCNMTLFLQENQAPLVLMGDEQGSCFVDSICTDFATYLDFLITSKVLCSRRKEFFSQSNGYQGELLSGISFDQADKWSLDMLVLVQDFPLADQLGSSTEHIETQKMQAKAYQNEPLHSFEIEQIIIEHQDFLNSGGIGGAWQIIAIKGQVLGVYKSKKYGKGNQAILDMQRINDELYFSELYLPYSSWCGVYAKAQNFSKADLTGSIMIDANLEQANFREANLENVDFSRSNLKGVNFLNANLSGADFENSNLTGADLRGANLKGTQFRGAVLKDVLR
jgi:hypothetical protein